MAKLIKKCKAIVWDEAPMADGILLEALDRLLRYLMETDEPFGGKVVVCSGDFRQLPTVKPKASRAQIVKASIKKSQLWRHFRVVELKENMRIMNCGNNKNLVDFDKWLQCLGDGNLQTHGDTDYVTLPSQICTEIENGNEAKSEDEAISFVFGHIETECTK